jgi:hypothetical protein
MKERLALINAGIKTLVAAVTGKETTLFVSSCSECCEPTLRPFKVSYFNRERKWVSEEVKAYTADEAAAKLNLKAGYNCFVSRQIRRI